MKTKVTIPVLLTVELNEPDARAGAALLRELIGTKRHHTTVQVLHAKIESCCATLHGEVSLPNPGRLAEDSPDPVALVHGKQASGWFHGGGVSSSLFVSAYEAAKARQKRKPAKSKPAK
jgi:hypothetical protein